MDEYSAIKAELEERLRELSARVEEINDDLSQPGNHDWAERATESEDDEVLSTVGNLSLKEIRQINHALHQIEIGAYGRCESCGTTIAKARLEALPYSTKCTACAAP